MADLIERDAALARIDCCLGNSLGGRKEFDSGLLQARKFVTSTPAVNQWIPYNEKRPDCFGEYLTYNAVIGKMLVLSFSPEYNTFGIYDCEVSHWMPLPEPPESEVQHD